MENGTIVNIPNIESEDDFWDVIYTFQNGILAGHDLFISTLPQSTMNQSNILNLECRRTFVFCLGIGSSLSSKQISTLIVLNRKLARYVCV